MSVRVFDPKVSVILKKNVTRQQIAGGLPTSPRFRGTPRQIDLTPYLGENGAVVTEKNVREPMGKFSITLADMFAPGEFESLYGVIEPMDVIEIRMARDTSKYAGKLPQHMPIIMRGFVSAVRRSQAMTERGPVRTITVVGGDYGKILNIIQYALYPGYAQLAALLSAFSFFTTYGAGGNPTQDASAFVEDINQKVITPFLQIMASASSASAPVPSGASPIVPLTVQALVQGGFISPRGINGWEGGSIYSLLRNFGDVGAWNELFVQDFEAGPYLIYRPNPFRDVSGAFINEPYVSSTAPNNSDGIPIAPPTRVVTDAEVIAIDVSRSDEDVANYYWVDSDPAVVDANGFSWSADVASKGAGSILNNASAAADLYGFRIMRVETHQGWRLDGYIDAVFQRKSEDLLGFLSAKKAQLIAQNEDNSLFERGEMRLRGREDIHAGEYVKLEYGTRDGSGNFQPQFSQLAYAHSVRQEYLPFRGYFTHVTFDRGTGFIERVQRGGGTQSPALAEIKARGVYNG